MVVEGSWNPSRSIYSTAPNPRDYAYIPLPYSQSFFRVTTSFLPSPLSVWTTFARRGSPTSPAHDYLEPQTFSRDHPSNSIPPPSQLAVDIFLFSRLSSDRFHGFLEIQAQKRFTTQYIPPRSQFTLMLRKWGMGHAEHRNTVLLRFWRFSRRGCMTMGGPSL